MRGGSRLYIAQSMYHLPKRVMPVSIFSLVGGETCVLRTMEVQKSISLRS